MPHQNTVSLEKTDRMYKLYSIYKSDFIYKSEIYKDEVVNYVSYLKRIQEREIFALRNFYKVIKEYE